jgi:hypothetical protein
VYLVPLHVAFVNDLVRGHAHWEHQGRDTMISWLSPHVLTGKSYKGILAIKGHTSDLDGPTLEVLLDGSE